MTESASCGRQVQFAKDQPHDVHELFPVKHTESVSAVSGTYIVRAWSSSGAGSAHRRTQLARDAREHDQPILRPGEDDGERTLKPGARL